MAETTTQYDAAELIRTHQAGVWRYLRAVGCDAVLAEDLTQETFLWVLQNPFQQYSRSATAAYLRKVARNLFISAQRRAGRDVPLEQLELLDAAWGRWADDDGGQWLLEALRACWQTLNERARRALELRFAAGQSRADIAAALQMTENGAKNLMQRAKEHLRACIERKRGS